MEEIRKVSGKTWKNKGEERKERKGREDRQSKGGRRKER
jgi:hypothetical protein